MDKMLQIKSSWSYMPGGESIADHHPADILYKDRDTAELVTRGSKAPNWTIKMAKNGQLEAELQNYVSERIP